MRGLLRCASLVLLLAAAAPAFAGSFAQHHPDQWFRGLGIDAWNAGEPELGAQRFREAARYGDKTSQLLLASMHWHGLGVAQDRALAYAYADLAAERGYPEFLRQREGMWAQLDRAEQARALEVGAGLYAEFGDTVAKPRLERHLRAGRALKTGTRTNSGAASVNVIQFDASTRAALVNAMTTAKTGGSGAQAAMRAFTRGLNQAGNFSVMGITAANVAGSYYDDANWEPKAYWRHQDALWLQGTVEVGELRASR